MNIVMFGAGSLTGSNYANVYSPWDVQGIITKVEWTYNTANDANGSVWLYASGTNEQIHRINGFAANVQASPQKRIVDSANTAISGTTGGWFQPFVVDGRLLIAASGIGSGFALGNVKVYYSPDI